MMTANRALAVAAIALVAAAPARAQADLTEKFSKTVHLDENGTFDLTNITGNITVTGGSGRDVSIEAIKHVQRPRENAARALLQMIDIQVAEQANRVEVRTVYPRPRNFPGSVEFTVTLPEDANVTLKTVTGNIRATNVKGELRADVVIGNIVATGAKKLEALKCVTGDVEIVDGVAEDPMTASTVSGGITARGLKARAIQLSSVSGNIRVDDSQIDRMMAKAVQGNLDFTGELARNGRYELVSHSGDIKLQLAGNTGFEVQANSFSGTVRSDFAVNRRGAPGAEGRRGGPIPPDARAVRGAFGDASAMLVLRAFSGNIAIARR